MRYIPIILLLCWATTCSAAELLIDNYGKEKGEVICVRPNGFKWSESELPRVIKIPDLNYKDAVKYEESFFNEKDEIFQKKYKAPDTWFDGSEVKELVKLQTSLSINSSLEDNTRITP